MLVCTANIKNFPDMTPAQVESDMKKVAKEKPDLILWQEIGEREDFETIFKVFGNDVFGTTDKYGFKGYAGGNLISWRRDVLPKVGSSSAFKAGPGIEGDKHTGSQWVRTMSFKPKGLPQIDVFCIHFIQGAFSKPGQVGDNDGRRIAAWNEDYQNTKAAALASIRAGHIAIVGGDWNRFGRDIPKMHSSQQWLVGGDKRIDGVLAIFPPSWEASVGTTYDVALNSDHDARFASVQFLKKVKRTPTIQTAIDQLAAARKTLSEPIPEPYTAGAKRALELNQQAINALLEVEK